MRRIWRINSDKTKERSVKIRHIRVIRVPFDSVFISPRLNVELPRKEQKFFFSFFSSS
jgi:hypothetical protein